MNEERARRLQAWFDGEVSAAECAEVEALLETDPEAQDYLDELNRTREGLNASHFRAINVDRAWTRTHDKLERLDERAASRVLSFPQLIAVAAAMMVLGMLLWLPFRQAGEAAAGPGGLESTVLMVETDLENATPVVYIDPPSGWTVVWVLEEPLPEKG